MKSFFAFLLCGIVFVPFSYSQQTSNKFIHQQELEYYNSLGITAEEYFDINQSESVIQNKSGKSCNLNKIVFGWHPYWSNGLETNYNWSLLSDLSYFSYEVDASTGNATNTHGWETSSVVDEAQANGVRVNLCVTLFSDHDIFFASSTAQQTLIDNLIGLVQLKGANGVNIDFEGVSSSLGTQLNSFLIDLCTQMHSSIPGSQVSVCLYAVDWGDVFDETALDPYVDYYTIMGYDYYYSGSSVAGPTSPLYTFNTFDFNLAKSVNYYMSEGASKEKLILGLPYYGMEWNTSDETVPSSATSYVCSNTYKTIRANASGNYSNRLWESTGLCPYYTYYSTSNWRQCFVDDEESLGYKYDFVNMTGIAGIGIWALGYDDGYTELWQLIQEKFTDCAVNPCNGTFYDLGGPDRVYFNDSDYSFTIAPTDATQVILEFPVFDIEAGSGSECDYDYIEIFDGEDTGSPSLGRFCNTTGNPGTIISSGNALTVRVYTDGATVNDGFVGNWTCVQDNIAPVTSVLANEWESDDFTASFTDSDNDAVNTKFYQVLDNDGTEWRANSDFGFFNDNFESEIHSDWTNISGTWSINNGHMMQSDESLSNENIYANVSQIDGGIYLYHWQMKISGSGANKRAGIYFFCDDPELDQRGNSYMIYFRVDQNACQIYKSTDNSIAIQTDDVVNIDADIWYDYKVIFDTNTGEIKAFQDGVLVSSWTDPSPHTSANSISLRTGNCNVEYDDIKVYKDRSLSEIITVGETNEVRFQNSGESNPSCRVKSIIIDDSDNFSNLAGTDVNIDWTESETIADVNDGSGVDIDTTYIGTELSANWGAAIEPNSSITTYEYCIGLSAGSSDIVGWTDNGISTSVTHTGLTLVSETQYYFNVRATNTVGLVSSITSSDGVKYVDPGELTIADFEFEDTGICEGLPFTFINYSVNANSYFWTITGTSSFTSTEENPEFYPEYGNYTVKMVAYGDINNDSITKTAIISVTPLPIADFTALETTVELPNASVSFINNSQNAVVYEWDFGDGQIVAEEEPSHVYTAAGLYTVRLEAISFYCGSDTQNLEDYILVVDPTIVDSFYEEQLSVYPNPVVTDWINIMLTEGKIKSVKLYSVSGDLIMKKDVDSDFVRIDVSGLSAAAYLIDVETLMGSHKAWVQIGE